jgi:hypothetical protein
VQQLLLAEFITTELFDSCDRHDFASVARGCILMHGFGAQADKRQFSKNPERTKIGSPARPLNSEKRIFSIRSIAQLAPAQNRTRSSFEERVLELSRSILLTT